MIRWDLTKQQFRIDQDNAKKLDWVVVECDRCHIQAKRKYAQHKQTMKKKGRYYCSSCAVKSPTFKKQCSDRAKEKWKNEDYKNNVLMATNMDQYKQKLSKSSKERWKDEQYKKDMSKKSKERWKNKNYRDKITTSIEEFIEKANKVHNNRYDYSKVEYKHSKEKITIICPEHGEFEQIPSNHINNKSGCLCCARQKMTLTTKEFIEKANGVHDDKYDYSKVEYIQNHDKIVIVCSKHGEFEQMAGSHLGNHGCPKCAGTHSQNEIFDFVKRLGFNSRYNDRTLIKPLELDIYISDKQIAIEFNGLYWHSFDHRETTKERNRHSVKCDLCQDKNIRLVQINEYEWIEKQDIVKSILKSKLGISNRIYARKCKIKEISSKEHFEFMDQNHIQGGKGCNVAYGLEFEDELVAVMSFNKHNKYEWEITRFANKLDTTVVGGASRLFKRFIEIVNPNQILTYADRRYSDGNLYKILGFKLDGITRPNYCYVKRDKIFSRQQFQKHKLKNKLESFDPNLTEAENMFNNRYRRLWDAGNYRFLWR